MQTKIIKVDMNHIDSIVLEEAGEIIRNGGLVAFPTETVYGLGANALREEAAAKIYEAKGRPSDNPLIVHIADIDTLNDIVSEIPKSAELLMNKFWPGPLTLIFKRKDIVPYKTTGGLDTVAVRFPSHPVALKIIKASQCAIAAPSANTSGRPSCTTAKHVIDDLYGKVDMIIDSGNDGVIGLESTILDVTQTPPMLLRPGYITKPMIESIVGPIAVDKIVDAKKPVADNDKNYKPKAPGMKYKHYAPKGDLTIFEGTRDKVVSHIKLLVEADLANDLTVGIIATEETKCMYEKGLVLSVGNRDNDESIAKNLFMILRHFDDVQTDVIYSEAFYDDNLGTAIMNRLIKAAGYKIVHID